MNEIYEIRFVCPTTINKYFEWKEIERSDFRKQWRARKKQHLLRTPILDLNGKIAKGVNDIKRYFPTLIDLKPHQELELVKGTGHYSLGGFFNLNHSNENYQIKIIVLPSHKLFFKIGLQTSINDDLLKIEEFILYTFAFLFSK